MRPDIRAAAWSYHLRGWSVIPLRERDKRPAVEWEAFQHRRPDDADLEAWWGNGRTHNVGIVTGSVSGLVVVDVDGPEGEASLADKRLPRTVAARTGKGSHHYFAAPGVSIPNAVRILPGVDLRADGGYVVAPPSIHPSGKVYRWLPSQAPGEVEVAPLPQWVLPRRERGPAPRVESVIGPGRRNDALASLAGTMRRRGMTEESILVALLAENEARCRPPLERGEVEKIAASVSRYAPAEPAVQPRPDSRAAPDPWPHLDRAALYGLAGDFVRSIDPYTEADPAALLASFLVGFGSAAGSGPHAVADGARHPARINVVLVGKTSRSRKGTSWAVSRDLLSRVDPQWAAERVVSGLASGEGLIAAVRDGTGEDDQGVTDKRVLVHEPEFARVLAVAGRDGSTLSSVIRAAWDDGHLRVMTRKDPLRATAAHISVLAHVTEDELRRRLSDTEAANGFANRFLFLRVRRSKLLPSGEGVPESVLADLTVRLRRALVDARRIGKLRRSTEAEELWTTMYRQMADGPDGLVGAITARAEAQVLRLSVLYALLDCSDTVDVDHLLGAFALWDYAEQSAGQVFGSSLGDPVADRLLEAVRDAGPAGLDGAGQFAAFGRHVTARDLDRARSLLESRGLARTVTQETGGRPRALLVAVSGANEASKAKDADLSSPDSLRSQGDGA